MARDATLLMKDGVQTGQSINNRPAAEQSFVTQLGVSARGKNKTLGSAVVLIHLAGEYPSLSTLAETRRCPVRIALKLNLM